jgi:hypothetical protein
VVVRPAVDEDWQLLAGVDEHDRQAVLRVLRQFRANATSEET